MDYTLEKWQKQSTSFRNYKFGPCHLFQILKLINLFNINLPKNISTPQPTQSITLAHYPFAAQHPKNINTPYNSHPGSKLVNSTSSYPSPVTCYKPKPTPSSPPPCYPSATLKPYSPFHHKITNPHPLPTS